MTPEKLAEMFHESYERLAPSFGYKTRDESSKPWAEVPSSNKHLMVAVAAEILKKIRRSQDENLEVIRDWKHHWMAKEDGYFESAFGIDANMVHHLARKLTEAKETT
jgi:hypothetical protein